MNKTNQKSKILSIENKDILTIKTNKNLILFILISTKNKKNWGKNVRIPFIQTFHVNSFLEKNTREDKSF